MTHEIETSSASTMDEKGLGEGEQTASQNGTQVSPHLERIGSQNKSTEANIFPEGEAEAEADLEKTGAEPRSPPAAGSRHG